MLAILQLEFALVNSLHNVTPHVFSALPDDPDYPLIHIESITRNVWLHKPLTFEVEIKLCLYTFDHSNKSLLELGEKVLHALSKVGYPLRIEESLVTQINTDLWCNDTYFKMWITEEGIQFDKDLIEEKL